MNLKERERMFGGSLSSTAFLAPFERWFSGTFAPRIPAWIGTQHLTLLTIPWSIGIVLLGYASQYDLQWLWGVSVMIALQWATDTLDGAVGRLRGTGLVKWGFYMDHFLDYIFLCSLLIGYSFIVPDRFNILFFILAVFGAVMVNSFLSFAATGTMKISYLRIGPTEIRIIFILINTFLIVFNTTYVAALLPYILIFSMLGLGVVVYRTQRKIWKTDMDAKENAEENVKENAKEGLEKKGGD